jgi:hypothetical protein
MESSWLALAKQTVFCYTVLMSPKTLLRTAASLIMAFLPAVAMAQGINLLEPIGGKSQISVTSGGPLGAFIEYFNALYPWVVGIAAAVAVGMGLIGGIQWMTSGGDPGGAENGKNRLRMSLFGLLLVLFSSVILHALNPTFFK